MNNIQKRGLGVPRAAAPALAGFMFVSIIAPAFYGFFLAVSFFPLGSTASQSQFNTFFDYTLGGGGVWIFAALFLTLYPATRGKIWSIRLIRFMAFGGLAALAAAILGDVVFLFVPADRGLALAAFGLFLTPLIVAAFFLLRGLLRQPWFDPNATPAQIGPSGGSAADIDIQAGLDEVGQLPPEAVASALRSPPPPRWLCYVAPPIAALRMRKWWFAAISTAICLAALVFMPFLTTRTLFVYVMMGGFADRQRAVAAYRRIIAQAQQMTG